MDISFEAAKKRIAERRKLLYKQDREQALASRALREIEPEPAIPVTFAEFAETARQRVLARLAARYAQDRQQALDSRK